MKWIFFHIINFSLAYLQNCSVALPPDDFSQNVELTHLLKGNHSDFEMALLKEQTKIQE